MEILSKKLSDLVPYYNNPRDNARAVEPVMESFRRFGFIKPIMVDKDMVIICGHTRYIASFRLGLEYVPVVVSDMPEEQAKIYRMLDNKLSEKSSFNEDELIEELRKMEVPQEMQAFFFEDIDVMLSFDINSFNSQVEEAGGFTTEEEYEPQEEEAGEEPETATGQQEPTSEPQRSSDPADWMFKVRTRDDGTKYMTVVCPYCGNIEDIDID